MQQETITILGQQVPLALLLVIFQDWLKKQKWFPLVNYEREKANRYFALVSTGLATIGVHMTLNTEGHSLTIVWPTMPVLIAGIWHWVQQYVLTKVSYKVLQTKLAPNGNGAAPTGGTK